MKFRKPNISYLLILFGCMLSIIINMSVISVMIHQALMRNLFCFVTFWAKLLTGCSVLKANY